MDPPSATWENCLELAALSDLGLRRANNQDSMALVLATSAENFRQRGHLLMVADGMGAHAAGELASKLATDLVPLGYNKLTDRPPDEALHAAVQAANDQIHSRGVASDDFRGMGTTTSVLVILPQGALVAHVGDSRVYRLRGNRLDQLTFDHSLVWELQAAGQIPADDVPSFIPKNIITRSLGPNPEVRVDLEGFFPIEPGDTFLLCSDGLSGQVTDDELGQLLGAMPPQEAVRALVDLANLRGGPDNITAVVARVIRPLAAEEATAGASPRPTRPQARRRLYWWILGISILLAVAAQVFVELDFAVAAAVACLLAVVGMAGVALWRSRSAMQPPADRQPLGKGPHRSRECPPQAAFAARLADLAKELRQATVGSGWTIDWTAFDTHESQAAAAVRASDFRQAIAEYCRAISFMMTQLRSQREQQKPPGEEDASDKVV